MFASCENDANDIEESVEAGVFIDHNNKRCYMWDVQWTNGTLVLKK